MVASQMISLSNGSLGYKGVGISGKQACAEMTMQSSFKLLPFAVAVLYLSKTCSGIGNSVTVQLQYSSPPTSYN